MLLVIVEWLVWSRGDDWFKRAGKSFGHLLADTLAMGVDTGIGMELQEWMNWPDYSGFVGDTLDRPLSAR